jgi:predicted benzoate:H+ symporter BenE
VYQRWSTIRIDSSEEVRGLDKMNPRSKAIVLNTALLVSFLALLKFYPSYAVALGAIVLFTIANLGLFFSARRKRISAKP